MNLIQRRIRLERKTQVCLKKESPPKKTTFEKRLKIIEDLIKHNLNYNLVANKNNVSYIQVYNWYKKYTASGNNPESLRDNRGKSKPEESLTELDHLKAENRLLKAQLEQQEMHTINGLSEVIVSIENNKYSCLIP